MNPKIFLPSMHRITMYKIFSTVLMVCIMSIIFSGCGQTQVSEESAPTESIQLARIVPDVLDAQTVYPTNHVIVPLDPLTKYTWQDVKVPEAWSDQGYYYEIWDSNNRPVAGFTSKKLESGQHTISLREIDPSLYPKIRLMIFQPAGIAPLPYVAPVYFSYTTEPNYRLLVFFVCILTLYGTLAVLAVRYRIFIPTIWRETMYLLQGRARERSLKQITIYGWITILWSGLFGVVLGIFVGGIQIFYLLIKLPYLLLGALGFSLASLIVLSLLLGIKTSIRDIATQTVELVATTAIGLAAFSPLILFYIYLPQNHDELLISTIVCIAAASGLAAYRLYVWLKQHQVSLKPVIIIIWFAIYGMVFLQLGWLLRPWVGVIDPVLDSVPFARSPGGNVFEELINALERIN